MQALKELIRDIDKHMRAEWYAGRLPAECWPKSLSDRLAAAVAGPGILSELEEAKKRWCKTMDRPSSLCGCPDCGSSLIDFPNTAAPAAERDAFKEHAVAEGFARRDEEHGVVFFGDPESMLRWKTAEKAWNARGALAATPAAVAVPDALIRVAKQALACMDGLQQHLGRAVCQVEADALRAALAATPAAAPAWDGKLPERMQRALNELRIDCKTDAVSSLEFEVRSAFEGMHTSLAAVKGLYHAAQKRLDSLDAAQPDPFAADAPVVLPIQLDRKYVRRDGVMVIAMRAMPDLEDAGQVAMVECGNHQAWVCVDTKTGREKADAESPFDVVAAAPAPATATGLPAQAEHIGHIELSGYDIPGVAKPRANIVWDIGAEQQRSLVHGSKVYLHASPQAQADARDAICELIAKHSAELEHNAYAYFELAYTRRTGWMAWITDKPLNSGPVINPGRKVLCSGRGDTPEEACSAAIAAAKAAE